MESNAIEEATPPVTESLKGSPGPYAVQSVIAAVHCRALQAEDTDWQQIVRLYDALAQTQPSPIVSLNRAVAVAMIDGPEKGLRLVDQLVAEKDLEDYHLLHATRADLLHRTVMTAEAIESYRRALSLATNESERHLLAERLRSAEPADAVGNARL